eukprot:jgi/Chlat1/5732/Chrsp38S05561
MSTYPTTSSTSRHHNTLTGLHQVCDRVPPIRKCSTSTLVGGFWLALRGDKLEDKEEKVMEKEVEEEGADDRERAKREAREVPAGEGEEEKKEDEEDDDIIYVNRAPVLTLWVAVVAEREGYCFDEGLTFGKAKHLGIREERGLAASQRRRRDDPDVFHIPVFGIHLAAKRTPEGLRALQHSDPVSPESVCEYLRHAFGNKLPVVIDAMRELAASYNPDEISRVAYDLYTEFRPPVAPGRAGWGQKGPLSLRKIRELMKKAPMVKVKGKVDARQNVIEQDLKQEDAKQDVKQQAVKQQDVKQDVRQNG